MSDTVLKVENVSVKYRLTEQKVDDLKDYLIKLFKRELRYKEFLALDDVSFTLNKGDRLAIMGMNGAGKSTLLKVIAGVLKASEGKVSKQGKVVPLLELGAGFDMQYTGSENIYLYGAMLGYSKAFLDEKYAEIVEFVGTFRCGAFDLNNACSGKTLKVELRLTNPEDATDFVSVASFL